MGGQDIVTGGEKGRKTSTVPMLLNYGLPETGLTVLSSALPSF